MVLGQSPSSVWSVAVVGYGVLKLYQNKNQTQKVHYGLQLLSCRSPPCEKHIRVSHLTLWPVPVQLCVTTPPHFRGLSEQLGPGLQALFSGLGLEPAPLSLQTDVDPAHPSSLARPPSIMGFSKQGVSKRDTMGWDAASHNSTYRPLLAPTPLLRHQLETQSRPKLNAIWNKPWADVIHPHLFFK